jgi:hypothetical protein
VSLTGLRTFRQTLSYSSGGPEAQGAFLILGRVLALFALVVPVFAQYGGPAILSRGDAPSGMTGSQISFRPFFEITGIYDTGLAGVAVNTQGQLGNTSSPGIEFAGGISGSHNWRHTQLGLDYHGDIRHYEKATYYDGSDQSLLLGIKHQFSRHVFANFRESAGMFSTGFALSSLQEAISYDPSQSSLPTTDFFDNRTLYIDTQADLIYQKSARLSFSIGGDGFINRRRSSALFGVTGATARGDVQYRITRRTTIGADYTYTNYSFTRIFSGTDIHSFSGTYAVQLSKNLEFSGYGGVSRVETKAEEEVAVDPTIAALLGITSGLTITHTLLYVPTGSARLSEKLHNGVLYFYGAHVLTPGNGLFLTSTATNAGAGYTYTGLRRWSFSSTFNFNRSNTVGVVGRYGNTGGILSASRQIVKSLHIVAAFSANQYESADFSMYNRLIYDARLGFGWTPGDVPLRVW